jgi:hypothetical protein
LLPFLGLRTLDSCAMVDHLHDEFSESGTVPTPRRPPVPRTPSVIAAEQRFESARVKVLFALLLYSVVASVMEWWPIDWLNLAQHHLVGSFSLPLSAIVCAIVAVLGQALLWSAAEDFVTRRIAVRDDATGTSAPANSPPRALSRPLTQSQLLVRLTVGTVLLVWIGAAAGFIWFDTQQRNDNTANYVALDLESPAPVHLSLGDHVSVQGIVLAGRTVTSTFTVRHSSPTGAVLIPVVPRGWRVGDAARVILQLHSASELPGFRSTDPHVRWTLPEPVLGRVQGSTSLIVQSQFRKIGVLLTRDYILVEVIHSQGGKPVQLAVDYLERFLWGAGVGSVFVSLLTGPSYFLSRRRERAELARHAEAGP